MRLPVLVVSETLKTYTPLTMGISDRDYYRRPTPAFGQMQMLSVTTWLIAINVAVFVIDQILAHANIGYRDGYFSVTTLLYGLGRFSLYEAIQEAEVWRFLTFQFLHANFMHLIFNMLALFFFGPMVESYLGRRRYLVFYLLCGIGGPIAYIILWATHFLVASTVVPLVGASAGIFGVLIAASQIAPETTVLLYGVFPIKMRTLAWVLLGVAVYTVLKYGSTNGGNAGGEAAHLGGAAVGYLLIHNQEFLRMPELNFLRRRRPPF